MFHLWAYVIFKDIPGGNLWRACINDGGHLEWAVGGHDPWAAPQGMDYRSGDGHRRAGINSLATRQNGRHFHTAFYRPFLQCFFYYYQNWIEVCFQGSNLQCTSIDLDNQATTRYLRQCWQSSPTHICINVLTPLEMDLVWENMTMYRKTSSISRTKFQSLNVSCVLLQLSSLKPLKPGVKLRMKM